MSYKEKQQMDLTKTETKFKIMTGFIHYRESDDLTKLFNILNEFRKNNGLKYSHQFKANMVFFNISSEHLEAFFKVRPFKISRFQTKSLYKCDTFTYNKLMEQKDSFLRMLWDEESKTLSLQSRTPFGIHGNLIRRIFRDSGIEFQKDNYSVLKNNVLTKITKNYGNDGNDGNDGNVDVDENVDVDVKDKEQNEKTQEVEFTQKETSEEFQKIEKKTRKPRTTNASQIIKETEVKPKIRGTKTVKVLKT